MEQLHSIEGHASQRILVLDGAMGSMIQTLNLTESDFRGVRFADHPTPLAGCNDLLCLTKPDAISAIHEAYLAVGADIIETCSFNATAVSLVDYGLADFAYEISRAAASIARKAADQFSTTEQPRFVAGSIGPTGKSASLSPNVDDPGKRGIYWDELEAAYYDNARGLLDGGADIFMVETVFDTLNAKAALFAIKRLQEERNIDIPIMISATVSGDSGRLLAGQTLAAFCASVLHAKPWAIGLNCSFGAEKLLPHLRSLSAITPCLVSAHPNAGLPNQLGNYDESPETMAACIERYLQDGLLNIVGGCCGSTPAHIAAIAAKAALYKPRRVGSREWGVGSGESRNKGFRLAGLESSSASPQLTLIGERANVAGSKKFLRLISEEKYNESLSIARSQINEGAVILGVGMDDAMLDAEKSMSAFLDLALSDPDIARVPVMIDSSRWNVIESGLKRLQGKGLVNSINLKDGETEFLRKASLVRRYGAAVVVMLIDENGQAVTYERKIEIAGRAYQLLVKNNFPSENIVFDPNVLAVATGIAEHDSCAIDFIRACAWIRENCPGVQISGGISNLSYSFRGNNPVREAMHSVFLKHAQAAGLTMAIVNPSTLITYNKIEEKLRVVVEDVILNRNPDAPNRLLAIAEQTNTAPHSSLRQGRTLIPHFEWRNLSVADRIIHAMIHGIDDFIEADVLELHSGGKSALDIVEGPLMDGMKEVGKRFDEGTMYLPQVIRSARVMKKAAAALSPYMEKNAHNTVDTHAPKIILATVKGDVHDIGKNIVGVVLACNGYQIIDLGVMVPAEQILEAAEKEQAAIIGLSGLISPSLDEMMHITREMEKRRMQIPLLIGGAAASLIYTSLRLAPEYSGPVVYVPNAGKSAETVRALLSETERPRFLQDLENSYRDAVQRHAAIQSRIEIISLEEAQANKVPPAAYTPVAPQTTDIIELNNYPLDRVTPHIDWQAFAQRWDAKKVSDTLLEDAKALLERVVAEGLLELRGVTGIFPAAADGDDIVIWGVGSREWGVGKEGDDSHCHLGASRRFCFPRNRQKKPAGGFNPCLADFIVPVGKGSANNGEPVDWLGLFALSAGFGLDAATAAFRHCNDEYNALLLASLANALAEAFTEEIHRRIRQEWWGYDQGVENRGQGIRPAFGYPACPNHEDKRIAFELLEAEKRCELQLTDTAMIIPAASTCGMFFASPAAYYFG
ncbi:MAG: methionine synthase [Treponema sp.]|nr:methionine synthase [Treponema sp.]